MGTGLVFYWNKNMLGILFSFAAAVSLVGAQSELCSHVETISRWSNGQRKFLKLNIDQYYTSWNITVSFDREVSFEAWKGDVVKVSNTAYSLTNKCFNNILYPCQCLELGYLIRYAPGFNPQAEFSLNGAPAPACEEAPACSGVTTTMAPSSVVSAEDDHGCTVNGTCPEGTLCTVTGENFNDYTCNCPQTSIQSGSGSNITCTANTTSLLRSLDNEGSDVTAFLDSQGLNSTAFTELGALMEDLEGDDDLELEDYFNILFNSSEATDLLATSTGADAEAQQAVIDALEGDAEAIAIFTETLDDDFALGGRKRRRRRQSTLSNKQIKILIRQFRRYVRAVKRILVKDGLYQEMLRLEEMLAENKCNEIQALLREIEAEILASNLENLILNAFTVKLELLDNIDAVLAHKQSFKFWRTLSIWIRNVDKILRGYLILELSELQCPTTETTTMAPVTEPSPAQTSVAPPSSVPSPSQTTVAPPSGTISLPTISSPSMQSTTSSPSMQSSTSSLSMHSTTSSPSMQSTTPIWWPNGRGWRRQLMGSNWGRQLRWGSSQDHFEGLQGPSQRGGHGYIRTRNIGGRQQLRQTRQTGR